MLGKDADSSEDNVRGRICRRVENDIRPILRAWGVTVISFQLESTKVPYLSFDVQLRSIMSHVSCFVLKAACAVFD